MILAYHAIWACYGFWLPNDPRGSWSNRVRATHLQSFGSAAKTTERRSLADKPHDAAKRLEAKQSLRYPPVRLTGLQARAVARGFADVVPNLRLNILACSILPDHVHLVIDKHSERIEDIVGYLKRAATRSVAREGLHPLQGYQTASGGTPSPWVVGGWNKFLNERRDVLRTIAYVERNPLKMGLKPQRWSFVKPYS